MEPTAIFTPFGREGPKVVLCGARTGDWDFSNLQKTGDHKKCHGLLFRLNQLAERYNFPEVLVPTPTDCNCEICHLADFTARIQTEVGQVVLRRGARADGVVLSRQSAGAIASADCPTIVAYCHMVRTVIIAHGGCKSVIDHDHVLRGNPPRKNKSIVNSLMEVAVKKYGFHYTQVFITCGISGEYYTFPELALHVIKEFGADCIHGTSGIDLKKIIAKQFLKDYGIHCVADLADTFTDKQPDGYTWHSYRRGKTPAEKAQRNLVLVVN